MSSTTSTKRVSPTAYATGYLWYRLGMSHPALATPQGKKLDRPFSLLMKVLGGNVFQNLMVARHKGIDGQLMRAIEAGQIGQVIEIAAGLSGRGIRMVKKYDNLTYIETDLPHMAALKRQLLQDAKLISARHKVLDVNALADDGPDSLAAIAQSLNPAIGTAIITEGLMNYFDPATARNVWSRIARTLKTFPNSLYLADVYLIQQNRGLAARVFGGVIQAFVRGRLHIHFDSVEHGIQLMQEAGFANTTIHKTRDLPETQDISRQPGGARVMVLEATT